MLTPSAFFLLRFWVNSARLLGSIWHGARVEISSEATQGEDRHETRTFLLSIVGVLSMMLGIAGPAFAQAQPETITDRAELTPVNSSVMGKDATGEATFTISGDDVTVSVTAHGVAPNMMHLQHFHGFTEGRGTSVCPTSDADTSSDGIIDILETEPFVGFTMVPFHDDPVSMAIVNDSYPVANADGNYTYEKTVSFSALEAVFQQTYPGQELDLERRVVFIHGVPDTTKLPDTVASLGDIPAQVTIPIACGPITLIQGGTPAAMPVGSPEATPSS